MRVGLHSLVVDNHIIGIEVTNNLIDPLHLRMFRFLCIVSNLLLKRTSPVKN